MTKGMQEVILGKQHILTMLSLLSITIMFVSPLFFPVTINLKTKT